MTNLVNISLIIISAEREVALSSGSLKDLDSKATLSERMQGVTDTLISLYRKGRPKTDEEVRQRTEEFMDACRFGGVRPAIESYCTALHISRETLRNWKNGNGCSKERQEIVQDARQLIIAEAEQLAFHSAIHPGVFAFYMKNTAGYEDNVSVKEYCDNSIIQRSREEILQSISADMIDALESED